jgi:chloride channel 3/4/5
MTHEFETDMDPFGTGKLVLFEVTTSQVWRGFELIPWLFMGVCGGIYGHVFIRSNLEFAHFRNASVLGRYPVAEVVGVAFVTALASYLVIFMRYVLLLTTGDFVSILFLADCYRGFRIPTAELVERLFEECSPSDVTGICE